MCVSCDDDVTPLVPLQHCYCTHPRSRVNTQSQRTWVVLIRHYLFLVCLCLAHGNATVSSGNKYMTIHCQDDILHQLFDVPVLLWTHVLYSPQPSLPFWHSFMNLTLKGKVGGFGRREEHLSSGWQADIENRAEGNGCRERSPTPSGQRAHMLRLNTKRHIIGGFHTAGATSALYYGSSWSVADIHSLNDGRRTRSQNRQQMVNILVTRWWKWCESHLVQ